MIINPYLVQPSIPAFTGLLDTYTGAAAAYSAARRLATAYNGSLIRVRRSSDNAEQDIGYTAGNVLDESALTTFVGAGNGFVTTWYDQSGNSNNASQATATNQPQIVSSGTIIKENSKPAISFDGSNDVLPASDSATLDISSSLSIFSVFSTNDGEGAVVGKNNSIFGLSADKSYGFGLFGNTMYFQISNGTTTHAPSFNYSSYLNNVPHLLSGIYINASVSNNIKINVDAVNKFQGTYTPINPQNLSAPLRVSADNASYFLNARHQEVILWPSEQSANESGINTNINTFYSIY